MSKARAAVIGLGGHGLRHLQAYDLLDGVEVAAVCDVRPESVSRALADRQGARGYTDWRELIAEEKPDILSVVTNGPTHAPITVEAARGGVRHVLCEKPMATSVRDAREMIRACRESGTRLSVSHGRRWTESYRRLRELIEGGAIGRPCHVWATCGGGLFAGNGTHMMDLARMLSGSEPVSVMAVLDKSGRPNPRGSQFQDPGAVALYQFASGMRLVIDMFEDLGVPPRVEIVGSVGRVLIDEVAARWEVAARTEEDRDRPLTQYGLPLVPVPFEGARPDLIRMLAGAFEELLGGGEISCTGEDGLASLQMVIGAHVSGRDGGRAVSLPLAEEYDSFDIPLT